MSEETNSNSTPSGTATNNPGGHGSGELVKGQVPTMRNPPPPPPTKKD